MLLYSDFSLTELNTFNLEAKAELYAEISDKSDIESFVRKRKYLEMPRIVLGNGSNIVFSSKSFKGVVLKNSIKGIEILEENEEQIVVKVASGEDFDSFVEYCVKKRFNGLENLSGIPGSIGGSVVQNIGAYGVEIKDYVQEVEYYDFTDFCFKKINASDCKFAYRDSVFKSVMKDTFITAVTLRLYKKFQPVLGYGNLMERISGINVLTPMILRKVILGIRFEKIPDYKQYGSAGSFFKNPEITKSASEKLLQQFPMLKTYETEDGKKLKLAAGQLIDLCGFKNIVEDDKVTVAKTNALIMINLGGATGKDIVNFAKKIQKSVKDKFGIKLEPEVVIC